MGVERDFVKLIHDRDIVHALTLMQNNEEEVDRAIMEYYPQKHKIMNRPNKRRKGQIDYQSVKLARGRQYFINEVALFFLLNNPIKWSVQGEEHNEEFRLFKDILKSTRFNALIRQSKRLSGAETQSAYLFHIYRNEQGEAELNTLVLARSTGYELRTLVDQYNVMRAFAYGYITKQGDKTIRHWDIQTADMIYNCSKSSVGWQIDAFPNPTGKINIVYTSQSKEWDNVQALCDREEDVMCRTSDNNNYFSDPIAKASADVIENMVSPESIGKFIQMEGDSVFDYITPPNMAGGWQSEKEELKSAILNDSFTPDFTYEGIRGYGSLSGSALRNALVIGYIKRSKNLEIWESSVDRIKNLYLAYLKIKYPHLKWDDIVIDFTFSDPFEDGADEKINRASTAKNSGIISTRTAIQMVGLVDDIDAEIQAIKEEQNTSQSVHPNKQQEDEIEQ